MNDQANAVEGTVVAAAVTYVGDLFNFAELGDLPENVREKLETQTVNNAKEYAAIVHAGAAAGYPVLNISQISAVAFRKFGSVPTQATVRAYLNEAVKLKLIGKPTRASYSSDTSVVVEGDDEPEAGEAKPVEAVAAAPVAAVDPLAGL